jgi:hypothetical protein
MKTDTTQSVLSNRFVQSEGLFRRGSLPLAVPARKKQAERAMIAQLAHASGHDAAIAWLAVADKDGVAPAHTTAAVARARIGHALWHRSAPRSMSCRPEGRT